MNADSLTCFAKSNRWYEKMLALECAANDPRLSEECRKRAAKALDLVTSIIERSTEFG